MSAVLQVVAAVSSGGCAGALASVAVGRLPRSRWAGPGRATADDAFSDSTFCLVFFSAVGAVLSAAVSLWLLPPCIALAWALSRRMPGLVAARRERELRSACDGQLDVLEDIIAMGVRAGLSFDAAVDVYCEKFTGELSRELRRARLSWKSGMVSRERALGDLAARVGSRALAQFAETSTQAIRYGSPLAEMLNGLARDLRRERRDSIERQVAKAPVKMLVPTAVCILPAMLIFVLGPAILQFAQVGI